MITDEELIRVRDGLSFPQMQRDMAAELIQRRDAVRMWSYPGMAVIKLAPPTATNDGIALSSISHPRAPFWSRVWSWFFPPKLHANALETVWSDCDQWAQPDPVLRAFVEDDIVREPIDLDPVLNAERN